MHTQMKDLVSGHAHFGRFEVDGEEGWEAKA